MEKFQEGKVETILASSVSFMFQKVVITWSARSLKLEQVIDLCMQIRQYIHSNI